jgi:uncharacterized Ntn-hydrolase superfamily protein
VTYSLIGRDAQTGEIGVAVQSQAFNTGAAVPWARAGVGAVATQSFTDRRYGWRGLELLADGIAPAVVLEQLRADDALPGFRQVGMMAADGASAQWTGEHCVPAAGGARGSDWLAQANMVASPRVWESMGEAFEATGGELALRLMAGLDAAEAAGGDWRGRGGAGIVVVAAEGEPWERVVDLRVEEGDGSLVELRRLLQRALGYRAASRATDSREDLARSYGLPDTFVRQMAMQDALRSGDVDRARALFAEAEADQPRWRDTLRTLSLLPDGEPLAQLLDD